MPNGFVRDLPRISVNKLGEFLTTASPTRRRSIIRGQKEPQDSIVARYQKATDPIHKFLQSGGTDPSPIANAIARLNSAIPKSDWVADDNSNTVAALKMFLKVARELPLDGVQVSLKKKPAPLIVSGVQISVRPDFVLQAARRGKRCSGVLKIHFIKNDENAISLKGQQYVSALCHQWLEKYGPTQCGPSHHLCLSLDLFRERIVEAPKSTSSPLKNPPHLTRLLS